MKLTLFNGQDDGNPGNRICQKIFYAKRVQKQMLKDISFQQGVFH